MSATCDSEETRRLVAKIDFKERQLESALLEIERLKERICDLQADLEEAEDGEGDDEDDDESIESIDTAHRRDHCYIGRSSCGCLVSVMSDIPDRREVANSVLEMLDEGETVQRVTEAEFKALSFGCVHREEGL